MSHPENLMQKIKLLTQCRSLQQLMDAGYEMIGNPMFVTDLADNVLAYTKSVQIDSPDWVEAIEKGDVTLSHMASDEMASQSSRVRRASVASKMPVLDLNSPQKIPIVVKSLLAGDVAIGFFVAAGYFKSFSDEDVDLFEIISYKVLLELQKKISFRDTVGTCLNHFIMNLLEHGSLSTQMIDDRLNLLKWRLAANNYVLVISARNTMAPVSLREVVADLEVTLHSRAIVYHGRIVYIFSTPKEVKNWDTQQDRLKAFLDQRQLVAGISRCFHSLKELPEYYMQAENAVEKGPFSAKDRTFHTYEEVAVYHLFELCAKVTDLHKFCHPSVLKLRDYDREHGTDFLPTLTEYLDNKKSLSKTAEAMYLHRNTIRYRIGQCVDILELDLSDTKDVFHINLTRHILSYFNMDSERTR